MSCPASLPPFVLFPPVWLSVFKSVCSSCCFLWPSSVFLRVLSLVLPYCFLNLYCLLDFGFVCLYLDWLPAASAWCLVFLMLEERNSMVQNSCSNNLIRHHTCLTEPLTNRCGHAPWSERKFKQSKTKFNFTKLYFKTDKTSWTLNFGATLYDVFFSRSSQPVCTQLS